MIACLLAAVAAVDASNVPDPAQAPEMPENRPFVADIAIRNPHDRAIRIERLDSTCTCTRREIADSFLLPGATTTLHVAVDNANRSGTRDIGVSIYLTDPDLDTIEVKCWWKVRPLVAVDSLPPTQRDTLRRPESRAWHDIYRYVAHERPDEPNRLRKRIRLESPPGSAPAGGLAVLGIEYLGADGRPGSIWRFDPVRQADGSWLISARAAGGDSAALAPGESKETVAIRTNHPDKARIELIFETFLDPEAGRRTVDPFAAE